MYIITDSAINTINLITSSKMPNYWHVACAITVNITYKGYSFIGLLQTGGFYNDDYDLHANTLTFCNSYGSLLAELESLGEDVIESGEETNRLNQDFDLDFVDSDYFAIYQEVIAACIAARYIVEGAESKAQQVYEKDKRFFVRVAKGGYFKTFDTYEQMEEFLEETEYASWQVSKQTYYSNTTLGYSLVV